MYSVTKRFITTATVAPGLYTSKSKTMIKEYLENEGLHAWAKDTTGVDDQGAISAEVTQNSSKGHIGGTVESEPFHCNVVVKDKDGNIIQNTDPHTNEPTDVWHAYLAKDKEDLKAKALAWKARNN